MGWFFLILQKKKNAYESVGVFDKLISLSVMFSSDNFYGVVMHLGLVRLKLV